MVLRPRTGSAKSESGRRERDIGQTARVDIEEMLAGARAQLDRVAVTDLRAEHRAGALVVDTRPVEQRRRDGELPGAVVVDRNVFEWRLDPASAWRIPEATDHDQRMIVVCDEGYSSSLAAVTLRQLGIHRATDLVGGFQAVLAAGLDPGTLLGR